MTHRPRASRPSWAAWSAAACQGLDITATLALDLPALEEAYGVKAIDDSTLEIELTAPAPNVASRFSFKSIGIIVIWSVVCALLFSGVHYVGAMSDEFHVASFAFRFILGLVLTLIYASRGFAAAVWTHAVYDVWVLVFR